MKPETTTSCLKASANATFAAAMAVVANYLVHSGLGATMFGSVVAWISVFLVEWPRTRGKPDASAVGRESQIE